MIPSAGTGLHMSVSDVWAWHGGGGIAKWGGVGVALSWLDLGQTSSFLAVQSATTTLIFGEPIRNKKIWKKTAFVGSKDKEESLSKN